LLVKADMNARSFGRISEAIVKLAEVDVLTARKSDPLNSRIVLIAGKWNGIAAHEGFLVARASKSAVWIVKLTRAICRRREVRSLS
jgi:hypothetical protein